VGISDRDEWKPSVSLTVDPIGLSVKAGIKNRNKDEFFCKNIADEDWSTQ
jgi:hypothetical protein